MTNAYYKVISNDSTLFPYTPSRQIPAFFYYPLCIGHYHCNIPYEVNRSSYDSFLLLYTKSGRGFVRADNKETEQFPGDVCLIDCYKPHYYRALSDWELMWLHFDGGTARNYFEYLTDQPYFHTCLKNALSYEKDWMQLYKLFSNHEPMPEPVLSQCISQLLTRIATNDSSVHGGIKTDPDIIDDTLTYINQHLFADLDVDFLASRVSLSPYYFSRKFKAATGYSPYQYILTSRINLAKFLLKTSLDTVKHIGYNCGFKSEHSFCCAFKHETGMTPSEFRQK